MSYLAHLSRKTSPKAHKLWGILLVTLMAPSLVQAAAPGGQSAGRENPINYQRPVVERRGGFAMALNIGYGVSGFAGYPNEVVKLDNPDFYAKTGASLGTSSSLWLGGALRDWLIIGGGLSIAGASANDLVGNQFGVVLHVDFFPLYSLGNQYQDLGVSFDGGLGAASVVNPDDKKNLLADGGSLSTVGISVFYEPWRFWHFSTGPQLSYTHGFSQSLNSNTLTLGLRFAFYGQQPKKEAPNALKSAGTSLFQF